MLPATVRPRGSLRSKDLPLFPDRGRNRHARARRLTLSCLLRPLSQDTGTQGPRQIPKTPSVMPRATLCPAPPAGRQGECQEEPVIPLASAGLATDPPAVPPRGTAEQARKEALRFSIQRSLPPYNPPVGGIGEQARMDPPLNPPRWGDFIRNSLFIGLGESGCHAPCRGALEGDRRREGSNRAPQARAAPPGHPEVK